MKVFSVRFDPAQQVDHVKASMIDRWLVNVRYINTQPAHTTSSIRMHIQHRHPHLSNIFTFITNSTTTQPKPDQPIKTTHQRQFRRSHTTYIWTSIYRTPPSYQLCTLCHQCLAKHTHIFVFSYSVTGIDPFYVT
jgi:hypothetical protein